MKKLLIAMVLFFSPGLGWAATENAMIEITLQQSGAKVVVEMLDNPASRDFMALLPLTAEFSDFARAEKIAHLPRRLDTKNSPTARELSTDFTYYAPWGNLAVFYQGFATDGQVYPLGRIVSGKEILANMSSDFTATIQKAN